MYGGPELPKFDLTAYTPPHYYGDIVRGLFVAAAIIMAATLPFFDYRLPVSTPVSIVSIVILGLAAGFTSPRYRWVLVLDMLISLGGTVAFGYFSVAEYQERSFGSMLFWINEVLAVLFLVALYYSAKTVRATGRIE